MGAVLRQARTGSVTWGGGDLLARRVWRGNGSDPSHSFFLPVCEPEPTRLMLALREEALFHLLLYSGQCIVKKKRLSAVYLTPSENTRISGCTHGRGFFFLYGLGHQSS